jgi:hypothetical protein
MRDVRTLGIGLPVSCCVASWGSFSLYLDSFMWRFRSTSVMSHGVPKIILALFGVLCQLRSTGVMSHGVPRIILAFFLVLCRFRSAGVTSHGVPRIVLALFGFLSGWWASRRSMSCRIASRGLFSLYSVSCEGIRTVCVGMLASCTASHARWCRNPQIIRLGIRCLYTISSIWASWILLYTNRGKTTLWHMAWCCLVVDRRFRDAYCLHHQGDEGSKVEINISG